MPDEVMSRLLCELLVMPVWLMRWELTLRPSASSQPDYQRLDWIYPLALKGTQKTARTVRMCELAFLAHWVWFQPSTLIFWCLAQMEHVQQGRPKAPPPVLPTWSTSTRYWLSFVELIFW